MISKKREKKEAEEKKRDSFTSNHAEAGYTSSNILESLGHNPQPFRSTGNGSFNPLH